MRRNAMFVITILSLLFAIDVSAQVKDGSKMLVTYFTFPEPNGVDASTGASRVIVDNRLYGTTEYVAKQISEMTGGDLFQIKTTHSYPSSTHKELIDYAKQEANSKTYPKISDKIDNFANYDIIFVGYPNWWYDMPMVIYTLFNDYDFSGKTIVPFCTHGGSGFSQSVETIKKLEKNAIVIPIPAIASRNATRSGVALEKWLNDKGFVAQ